MACRCLYITPAIIHNLLFSLPGVFIYCVHVNVIDIIQIESYMEPDVPTERYAQVLNCLSASRIQTIPLRPISLSVF